MARLEGAVDWSKQHRLELRWLKVSACVLEASLTVVMQ